VYSYVPSDALTITPPSHHVTNKLIENQGFVMLLDLLLLICLIIFWYISIITFNNTACFDAVLGGKKKPLKQPKKDEKELDDVRTFICFICEI